MIHGQTFSFVVVVCFRQSVQQEKTAKSSVAAEKTSFLLRKVDQYVTTGFLPSLSVFSMFKHCFLSIYSAKQHKIY